MWGGGGREREDPGDAQPHGINACFLETHVKRMGLDMSCDIVVEK